MIHQNPTPEEQIVEWLKEKRWHISFAESCTAGLAAARLVDVPAASSVFDASFVTYANEAKVKYLGVSEETIESYGVVSEPVARQMALGTARANRAEIGIGISGIAGPAGGSPEKPVGTVCFGFAIGEDCFTVTKHFGSIGRNAVRQASVDFVYDTLVEYMRNHQSMRQPVIS